MIKTKEHFIYILLLCLISLISFGGGYLFSLPRQKEVTLNDNKTITINVQKILPQDIVIKKNYIGHVEAIHQVQIVPYINGYVENVVINPGQFVAKGDLLITIDDAEYRAKVDAAEADVLKATAVFNYSKSYYERVLKSGKKAFSEIDIENAKNAFLQAEAGLKNAQAQKEFATINYRYTKIKAPISGVIGNFNLTSGNYVAPSDSSLLSIVQISPVRVVFSLTDAEYLDMYTSGELFKDSVIKLSLANGKTFKNSGHFKYTDNHFKPETNSLAVYAYFDNEERELIPNSYVKVEVLNNFKNIVLLNKNNVQIKQNGYFVTIARNNKLISVPIYILSEKEDSYVVKNSFHTDDCLVLDSTADISNDTQIKFNLLNS